MDKTYCIIGAGANPQDELLIAKMKEKFGENIILVAPQQAKEQGLNIQDIVNIPTLKITPIPVLPAMQFCEHKTGQQNRRERRENKRKKKKRNYR